ncbi:hypothetical protein N8198_05280 [Gammaproteobacteria bacterium]|nr:hypothetical protein [Gammaproteobacteria bacterium]
MITNDPLLQPLTIKNITLEWIRQLSEGDFNRSMHPIWFCQIVSDQYQVGIGITYFQGNLRLSKIIPFP